MLIIELDLCYGFPGYEIFPSLFVAIAGFRFDLKTLGPVKVRLLKLLFHGFSAFLFL